MVVQDSQDPDPLIRGLADAGCQSMVWSVQDSQDPNPLIRALAVRTMGCIRVDKITEYLCDPLQRCLKVSSWAQFQLNNGIAFNGSLFV